MFQHKRFGIPLAALLAGLANAGCSSDTAPITPDQPDSGVIGNDVDAPPGQTAVLTRPSKASTVAISEDDSTVMMVNQRDNSVSIFRTADDHLVKAVPTGNEPSSVVIAPDGKTAFVTNRADATVVKISGIDTDNPTVTNTVGVGSEPSGVALSPTGARVYVAEYAEGRITVLAASDLHEIGAIKGSLKHARTVAVTNNGNADDDDELVIVPEFFGEPNEDANRENLTNAVNLDKSRIGRVRIYDSKTLSSQTPILFQPRSSGIIPTTAATDNPPETDKVFTVANQLYAVGIRRDGSGGAKIYLPSVSASPKRPVKFDGNVYPVLWVGDLGTREEDNSNLGTVNLAERVLNTGPNAGTYQGKFFLNDIVDIDFVPLATGADSNVAYVISRGADAMQRITFDPAKGVLLGFDNGPFQVDLIGDATNVFDGCKAPNGIILRHDAAKAYVACSASKRLGVVSLGSVQALDKTVPAFERNTDPAQVSIDKGYRFFATGRGRWSGNSPNIAPDKAPTLLGNSFGNCLSCHPDGLSDNITWTFGTGPRQTVALDGTYSKHDSGGKQKQRALNWTGIFDELHDFEKNTRDTSGGLGAITFPKSGNKSDCGKLDLEERQAIVANVIAPAVRDQLLITSPKPNCVNDWDDIDHFVATIRPPRAPVRLSEADKAKVALGREIFGAGDGNNRAGCVNCHGGKAFTVSNVFWPQSSANSLILADATNPKSALSILNALVLTMTNQTLHLQKELSADKQTQIAPEHVTCGLRLVNTFGPAELEIRDNGAKAQGQTSGFNVPSLYGMSLGAPYLHSGLALTLDELLDPSGAFQAHLRAGNANFNPVPGDPAVTEALKLYVLSIDADSDELLVPNDAQGNSFDICPTSFAP